MSERKKTNKALYILTHDFKYEGLILLFLAVIAIVLGILIVDNTLQVSETAFLIGSYPKVFAWMLIALGIVSVLLSVWPFYKPSFIEMKRVSWPTRSRILEESVIVFTFSAILSLFFLGVDTGLTSIIDLLLRIGDRI